MAVQAATAGRRSALIDAGIKAIRQFLREYKQEDREAECPELQVADQLAAGSEARPADGAAGTARQQLELSVVREDYEEAARLRDQIRRLQGDETL